MSSVIIVANMVNDFIYQPEVSYIGVEKGAVYLMNHNIQMDYAIGDFDSITEKELNELHKVTKIIKLPIQKNESDGEYAIHFALQKYQDVSITGVFGGRIDHFIAIYHLLCYQDINFKMFDKNNEISKLKKGTYVLKKSKKYLSLFATEETIITLKGVKYSLKRKKISNQDVFTVSNEMISAECQLEIEYGSIMVIQSEDKKKNDT